jgi:hypothetical protein
MRVIATAVLIMFSLGVNAAPIVMDFEDITGASMGATQVETNGFSMSSTDVFTFAVDEFQWAAANLWRWPRLPMQGFGGERRWS